MRKERYYTHKTIQKKSKELLTVVEASRQRHADIVFQPARAALLVLDLQQYFLQENSHAYVPSAPAILPGIFKLIAAFSDKEYPVVVTRHVNTPEDAGMMSRWWRDLINPQSAYSLNTALAGISNRIQIDKPQYDAFHQTKLGDMLHQLGVKQVVICGVMTHLCCETTARSAFMHGFEVFFTVDGTATYNEELQRASLLTLSHGFVIPVLVEELLHTMDIDEA